MFQSIVNFDTTFSAFIANLFPHTPFFNNFFTYLSIPGLTLFVGMIILAIMILKKSEHSKEFAFCFLLSLLTGYVIVNILIKNIVQRPRPYVAEKIYTTSCPADYSFPSGHATTAFAGAVIFTAFDKKRRWWYYGLAFLISLSRIYLLCHYFLDVTFGALIGFEIGRTFLVYLPYKKKI